MSGRRAKQVPIRVVVVDPLQVVRAGISLLVGREADFDVVGEASDAGDGLEVIRRARLSTRSVVLIGLGLRGDHDAYWLIRTVRELYPTVRIVVTGGNSERMSVSRALFVGADGFLDKTSDPIEFCDGLRRAAAGETVLVGVPFDWLGDIASGVVEQSVLGPALTPREREVLAVAAQGLTAREIGAHLGVRERTVTTHLARIYDKLGVSGRIAAINIAARSGLVTVGSE